MPNRYDISEEQYAERADKAQQAGEASVEVPLDENIWGIEYYGDAPGAMGAVSVALGGLRT